MYCAKLRNIFHRNDEDKLVVKNKGIKKHLKRATMPIKTTID